MVQTAFCPNEETNVLTSGTHSSIGFLAHSGMFTKRTRQPHQNDGLSPHVRRKSPFRRERRMAREMMDEGGFIEILVDKISR
nr:hypothetical protein [Sinorhizobium fredii]